MHIFMLRSELFREFDNLSSLSKRTYINLSVQTIHNGLQQQRQRPTRPAQRLNSLIFFFFFYVRHTLSCVSAMRLTSIALWLAALVGLMVSSNGEANVCRPLYDEPAYETVTKIMDCPTVTSERGFFSSFVLGNETSIAPFNEIIE
jgi:hypothetical protein